MNSTWDKMDRTQPPTPQILSSFVQNPLWEELCRYLEIDHQSKPVYDYSRCSLPGWNVKYKKSGRSLCTLYPSQGSFLALVVVGKREKPHFDLLLPTLTGYTQQLYETTKDKNDLCWLVFDVADRCIFDDVKRCIALRRGK